MGLVIAPAVGELHTIHEYTKPCLVPYELKLLFQFIAVCFLEISKVPPEIEDTPDVLC